MDCVAVACHGQHYDALQILGQPVTSFRFLLQDKFYTTAGL